MALRSHSVVTLGSPPAHHRLRSARRVSAVGRGLIVVVTDHEVGELFWHLTRRGAQAACDQFNYDHKPITYRPVRRGLGRWYPVAFQNITLPTSHRHQDLLNAALVEYLTGRLSYEKFLADIDFYVHGHQREAR